MAGTFDKFEMGEVIEKRIPKGKNRTFPNQIKKPTNKPTFKWICQNFMNITVVNVMIDDQRVKQIVNLKDLQIKVIRLLGVEYEKYYF